MARIADIARYFHDVNEKYAIAEEELENEFRASPPEWYKEWDLPLSLPKPAPALVAWIRRSCKFS
jgi:hypothetical protein